MEHYVSELCAKDPRKLEVKLRQYSKGRYCVFVRTGDPKSAAVFVHTSVCDQLVDSGHAKDFIAGAEDGRQLRSYEWGYSYRTFFVEEVAGKLQITRPIEYGGGDRILQGRRMTEEEARATVHTLEEYRSQGVFSFPSPPRHTECLEIRELYPNCIEAIATRSYREPVKPLRAAADKCYCMFVRVENPTLPGLLFVSMEVNHTIWFGLPDELRVNMLWAHHYSTVSFEEVDGQMRLEYATKEPYIRNLVPVERAQVAMAAMHELRTQGVFTYEPKPWA
jgi:hypothetical protein